MTGKVENRNFVELDYTGKLGDGSVFDTTLESVGKENGLATEKSTFAPMLICVGEKQILPGLDDQLVGKEIGTEYTVELSPDQAFGKRDVKKIKIVPASTFKEHKLQPRPGLSVDVDGERGVISRVAGGRVIVNFNHPLAGKTVHYTFKVNRVVDDAVEQITSFLHTALRFPKEALKVSLTENKATVELPMALPPQFTDALGKKLSEITSVTAVEFTAKAAKKN